MNSKPILLDFPEQFESERLTLRAPRSGDGAAINKAVCDSFKELHCWMPWAQEKPTLEDSEEHCRASRAKFLVREDLQLLLFLKGTDTLVGSSGLHRIDWNIPKFEIGYWCRTSLTGQGYMTEAVHAIACFAFDALSANRIEIKVDSKNEKSWKIPERLGFTLEGTLRNDCHDAHDALRDTRIYSVLTKQDLLASR